MKKTINLLILLAISMFAASSYASMLSSFDEAPATQSYHEAGDSNAAPATVKKVDDNQSDKTNENWEDPIQVVDSKDDTAASVASSNASSEDNPAAEAKPQLAAANTTIHSNGSANSDGTSNVVNTSPINGTSTLISNMQQNIVKEQSRLNILEQQNATLQIRVQQMSQSLTLVSQQIKQLDLLTVNTQGKVAEQAKLPRWLEYTGNLFGGIQYLLLGIALIAIILLVVALAPWSRSAEAKAVKRELKLKKIRAETAAVSSPPEVSKPRFSQAETHSAMDSNKQPTEESELKGEYDFMGSDEGIPAKLDLARAYIAMEEYVSAKEVLQAILHKGNAQQRAEAKNLLNEIPVTL